MPFPAARNCYVGLESTKRAGQLAGPSLDPQILRQIRSATKDFETDCRRCFIPYLGEKMWRWPTDFPGWTWRLWTEEDLLAVTTLYAAAEDTPPITLTHYFLEPQQFGPPYNRVEVDLSSQDVFQSGNTPQRSAAIVGKWGYYEALASADTLVSGLASDLAATTCVVSNSAPCETGEMLKADEEQMQIVLRAFIDTTATLAADLAATAAAVSVQVSSGALIHAGEIIAIDSEKMFVVFIVGNVLTVERAYDGSVLAAHTMSAAVNAPRGLTLERAQNGTVAALHANSLALQKYVVPDDLAIVIQGETLSKYEQGLAHWGRTVGSAGGGVDIESTGRALAQFRARMVDKYKRVRGEEAV